MALECAAAVPRVAPLPIIAGAPLAARLAKLGEGAGKELLKATPRWRIRLADENARHRGLAIAADMRLS